MIDDAVVVTPVAGFSHSTLRVRVVFDTFTVNVPPSIRSLLSGWQARGETSPWAPRLLRRLAQSEAERRNTQIRAQSLELDRKLERMMAFAGESE